MRMRGKSEIRRQKERGRKGERKIDRKGENER